MNRIYSGERGFTLLEVLVALVVAGFLLALLMRGAVEANMRLSAYDMSADNLTRAEQLMAQAIEGQILNAQSTEDDETAWTIDHQVIATDQRGQYQLVEISVSAGDQNAITLRRRLLMRVNNGIQPEQGL